MDDRFAVQQTKENIEALTLAIDLLKRGAKLEQVNRAFNPRSTVQRADWRKQL